MAASLKCDTYLRKKISSDKRLSKKLAKLTQRLSCKESLDISVLPSKVLCVQNGGLGNDVCQEELLSLVMPYGEVERIQMLPKKPYCFVYFTEESAALSVFENLNGHILREGKDTSQNVVLYFLFIHAVPDHGISSFENKPPGLLVMENFVDVDTERDLLLLMDSKEASQIDDHSTSLKHRCVKHFGYEFRYDINDVDMSNPLPGGLPSLCHPIIQKALDLGIINHYSDQITINKYYSGQGIPPHVDTQNAFEDGIMSLSLGCQVVMEFRHPDGRHLSVVLPQRSLMVMTGESRYIWSHGITPRKSDIVQSSTGKGLTLMARGVRTSFTFRKVIFDRQQTCLESNLNLWTVPQTDFDARNLEKVHVHKVYEDIADHFSGTRYKPWPRVVDFLMDQPPHSLMVDVGCGNGKCLGINKSMFEIGCDYSTNLASICRQRGFQTCVADGTCLPFRTNAFNVVLCIAVIHHMATQGRRVKAMSELIRILQPGGKALVYVWAMEQHFDHKESKYIHSNRQKQVFLDTGDPYLRIKKNKNNQGQSIDEEDIRNISLSNSSSQPQSDSLATTDTNSSQDPVLANQNSKTCEDVGGDETLNNCATKPLKVHVNRTQFQEQDMLVPWQLKGKDICKETNDKSSLFHRFYHVFKQGELEELCKAIPNCQVDQSYYDQGNWCVILQKS